MIFFNMKFQCMPGWTYFLTMITYSSRGGNMLGLNVGLHGGHIDRAVYAVLAMEHLVLVLPELTLDSHIQVCNNDIILYFAIAHVWSGKYAFSKLFWWDTDENRRYKQSQARICA